MMSTISKPLDISFLAPSVLSTSAVNWRPQQLILHLHPNEPDEVPIEVDVMKFISSNPNEGLKRNPAMVRQPVNLFAHINLHICNAIKFTLMMLVRVNFICTYLFSHIF